MPELWWFTEDDGEICLGTKPSALAAIVFATGVTARGPIKRRLTESEITAMSDALGELNNWSANGVALFAVKTF
tara:strand:+ start:653 stop:874 length:222 start_codon:yes stop_codon:yes gene_type:complete